MLQPGSAVVYRVDGPISKWKVYGFAPSDKHLAFEVSADGKTFRPITPQSQAFPSSQTVYGYSTPTLFSGTTDGGDATHLRIAIRDAGVNGGEKKKRGTEAEAKPAAVELSRVEIEYDRVARPANAPKRGAARAAPLNSAIFVDSNRPIDATLNAIDEAAKHGERQLNVVVAVLVDLTDDLHIKSFGSVSGRESRFKTYNDAMRDALREKLHKVFARMVEHNMAIFVLPHIDAGGEVQEWRNWVDFDPLESYGGYAYADLVLGTIADELAKTVKPTTRVELALSGEMGTSLFRYPESYRTIARRLRERPELKHMKIGISLNHSGIAGQGNPTGAKDIRLNDDQRQSMQALIDESDFVGMSFYAPVSVSPTTDDFVRGIDKFMNEFKELGLKVPTSMPMQFSEVGIGGRDATNGVVDLQQAVESPWEGTGNPRSSPWADESMRKLRRQYHAALIEFLATQPAEWRVSAAFFWSMGSWDPWGHGQPEFADLPITSAVEKHNRAITNE